TGYLHALRDQAVEVVMATAADAPWAAQLADPANLRGEMKLGVLRTAGHAGYGAMLSVLDVKAALEGLPVAPAARGGGGRGGGDGFVPENERAWRVQARDGRLAVRAESTRGAGRESPPRLTTSVELLAILAAGAVHPLRAVEAGLVESHGGAAERIEPWFRARS